MVPATCVAGLLLLLLLRLLIKPRHHWRPLEQIMPNSAVLTRQRLTCPRMRLLWQPRRPEARYLIPVQCPAMHKNNILVSRRKHRQTKLVTVQLAMMSTQSVQNSLMHNCVVAFQVGSSLQLLLIKNFISSSPLYHNVSVHLCTSWIHLSCFQLNEYRLTFTCVINFTFVVSSHVAREMQKYVLPCVFLLLF